MSKLIFHLPTGEEQAAELRPGEPFTIGRGEDNTVRLDDGTVSRHHARLTRGGDGVWRLEDLRSANGTALNSVPLTRPEALQDGDRLLFGLVPVLYLEDEASVAHLPTIEPTVGASFAVRYQLEQSEGETSEYHNFLARDLAQGGRLTSLKIFHPGVITQAIGFERAAQKFARICEVPGHPYLVRLLDFARWRGTSYLGAEWIEGYALLDLLRRRGALAVHEAMRLARQAAAVTDHLRSHGLPAPDLNPRPVLIAFDQPLAGPEWEDLLDKPLERWPAFTLKITPRLFASATPSPAIPALVAMVYELLGHPLSASGASRLPRIASLGEIGNKTLAQGAVSSNEAFGSDVAFIDALTPRCR